MEATTRSRIVGAAEALFYEQGLRSVSVDAIAARAGVTKRTLYYHFDSKDSLVAAYLAARDAPTMDRYRHWLGTEDRPLPERISSMFGVMFLSHQIGAFLGAWLGGLSYQWSGSYSAGWISLIVVGTLAALLQLTAGDESGRRGQAV